jgi:hypothetical protein
VKKSSKPLTPLARVSLFAIVTLAVVMTASAPLFRSRPRLFHFKVDREIAATLRVGAAKSSVLEYCKLRGWQYSDNGDTIVAVRRAAENNLVVRTDVVVTFQFDTAGKLVSFHSEDQYTGP